MRFSIATAGTYRFVLSGPPGGDPDAVLHSEGAISLFEDLGETEQFSVSLATGDYVLEVYEFSNITDSPRGRTCIDTSVVAQ